MTNYDYDLNDNRLSVTGDNEVGTYVYQAGSNRLDYTDDLDDTVGPEPTAQASRDLIYNDAGRLFQLLEDGELKGEYIYNDQGQCTRKIAYSTDTNRKF